MLKHSRDTNGRFHSHALRLTWFWGRWCAYQISFWAAKKIRRKDLRQSPLTMGKLSRVKRSEKLYGTKWPFMVPCFFHSFFLDLISYRWGALIKWRFCLPWGTWASCPLKDNLILMVEWQIRVRGLRLFARGCFWHNDKTIWQQMSSWSLKLMIHINYRAYFSRRCPPNCNSFLLDHSNSSRRYQYAGKLNRGLSKSRRHSWKNICQALTFSLAVQSCG